MSFLSKILSSADTESDHYGFYSSRSIVEFKNNDNFTQSSNSFFYSEILRPNIFKFWHNSTLASKYKRIKINDWEKLRTLENQVKMLQISTDVLNKNREANGCTKPKTFNVPPDPKFLLQMKSRRLERIEKKFKRMQNQKSLQESLIKSQNIYDSQRDLKKNSQTKINEIIQKREMRQKDLNDLKRNMIVAKDFRSKELKKILFIYLRSSIEWKKSACKNLERTYVDILIKKNLNIWRSLNEKKKIKVHEICEKFKIHYVVNVDRLKFNIIDNQKLICTTKTHNMFNLSARINSICIYCGLMHLMVFESDRRKKFAKEISLILSNSVKSCYLQKLQNCSRESKKDCIVNERTREMAKLFKDIFIL